MFGSRPHGYIVSHEYGAVYGPVLAWWQQKLVRRTVGQLLGSLISGGGTSMLQQGTHF
jgi:hypothetical protein